MNKGKTIKSIIAEGNFGISNYAIKAHEKLNSIVKTEMTKGLARSYTDKIREDGLKQIKLDIYHMLEIEKENTKSEMNKLRDEYNKEYSIHANENRDFVNDVSRRFNAMTNIELEKEVEDYSHNDLPVDPRIVDALSIAVKSTGNEVKHSFLRETASKKNYMYPELKTDEGKILTEKMKALDCNPGEFPAIIVKADGRKSYFKFNLDDLDSDEVRDSSNDTN